MSELAARIKSKYPQYQNVPDDELEQKIVAKYPQYASMAQATNQENSGLLDGAIRQGIKSATDPMLKNFGLDSQSREMQEMYGRGREAILESDMPVVGKGARSSLSQEGPILTIPDNPIIGRQDLKFSPQNIVKQIQGLGIDVATGLPADVAASKGPMVARSISKPISEGAENIAGRLINSLIKPGKKAFRFERNPGESVAKHVGPKMSLGGLEEGIGEATNRLSGEVKSIASKSKNKVDITPVFEHIRNVVKELRDSFPDLYENQIKAHQDFASGLERLAREGGEIGKDGRMYVSPQDAIDIRRQVSKLPSWDMNDPKLGSLTKTSRESTGILNKEITKAVPELKEKFKDWSGLIEAERATQGREAGSQSQAIGFNPIEMITAAALGGGDIPRTIIAGAGLKAVRSTPVVTTAASGLSQGAKAVRSAGNAIGSLERPSLIEELIRKLTGGKSIAKGAKQLAGETKKPQITGPIEVKPTGPARLKPTQFEGEGFRMTEPEFGGSPTPQIRPSEQLALPAPENIYGEGFKTLTPEEQTRDRLRSLVTGLPQGPTPEFPEVYIPGPYSEVRPVQPEVPFRGTVNLEPKTPRQYAKKSTSQKGEKTKQVNKLLERFRIWGLKGMEE